MSTPGLSTTAIHTGFDPDPATGSVNPPVYLTSTYAQNGAGDPRGGYAYARTSNPTRTALERKLAAVERGTYARAFGSGMAAIDVTLRALLRPGDEIIIPDVAYSGTYRLVNAVFTAWGISCATAAVDDIEAVAAAMTPRTRVIWLESPTNPLLSIADIAAVAALTHDSDVKLVVDNTFASPYLQNPMEHGADVVVESPTKYLGGHSDAMGGAVITHDDAVDDAVGFLQNAAGAVPGPMDCYLLDRGIKTLPVRMERHCDNAEAVAEFLTGRDEVERVLYPGLPSHPHHDVAARQMRRFGGMVSFLLRGDADRARRFCAATKLFTLAESLGGVESLIEHPGSMTHNSTTGTSVEVPRNLIRLSVGIEDAEDLINDLAKALSAVG